AGRLGRSSLVNRSRAACLLLLIACDAGGVHHAAIAAKEPVHAPADAQVISAPALAVIDAGAATPPLPIYSCMAGGGDPAPIAHMLLHGLAAPPCAELSPTDRAAKERELAPPLVASGAAADRDAVTFAWGCTSHGETPVVVSYYGVHDTTGAELWSVRGGGKARQLDSVSSPAPDE